jgi:hypothetical protein
MTLPRWPVGVVLGLLACMARPGAAGAQPPLPDESPPERHAPSQSLPACGCEHVYIYMINGLTVLPYMAGSMDRVKPFVEELGFCNVKVATHYWRWSFERDIRRVRAQDPDARFVLVGYSIGGSVVCSMAHALEQDGIFIDLIVYIDAHSFVNDFTKRPTNVGKIVAINSNAWVLRGTCRPGQECYTVDTRFHLATPRRDETLQILAEKVSGPNGR